MLCENSSNMHRYKLEEGNGAVIAKTNPFQTKEKTTIKWNVAFFLTIIYLILIEVVRHTQHGMFVGTYQQVEYT